MSDASNHPAPRANTVIAGRYRLDEHRAHGGMADVWKATDLSLNRTVAVKLLKPHLATEGTVAERFRREALVAAGLNDPHVVTVHDAVEDNGRQAVIMEFVDGKSLRETLDKKGSLSLKLTVHIGVAVCAALDAAHRAGIIHRDVKPGNILLTENGRVMLTDFGIAKALSGDQDLTNENIMMGTAKYLSPEQVLGDELGPAADVYSLGLVLYECLAGKVPFMGASDTETALARLKKDPTPLHTVKPDLDPGVLRVIHRMLEREPGKRYATGAEASRALRAAGGITLGSSSTEVPRSKDPTPPPNKVIRTKTGGTPSSGTPRDRTPSAPIAKKPTFPMKPAWLAGAVVGLLAVGVVVASVTGEDSPTTTVAPSNPGVTTTLYSGPVQMTGVRSFDPESDRQGRERRRNLQRHRRRFVHVVVDRLLQIIDVREQVGGRVGVADERRRVGASPGGHERPDLAGAGLRLERRRRTVGRLGATHLGWQSRAGAHHHGHVHVSRAIRAGVHHRSGAQWFL